MYIQINMQWNNLIIYKKLCDGVIACFVEQPTHLLYVY